MEQTGQPKTRVRVEHKCTVTKGWMAEHTVEVEWQGAHDLHSMTETQDAYALQRLTELIGEVAEIAETRRQELNRRDGYA